MPQQCHHGLIKKILIFTEISQHEKLDNKPSELVMAVFFFYCFVISTMKNKQLCLTFYDKAFNMLAGGRVLSVALCCSLISLPVFSAIIEHIAAEKANYS